MNVIDWLASGSQDNWAGHQHLMVPCKQSCCPGLLALIDTVLGKLMLNLIFLTVRFGVILFQVSISIGLPNLIKANVITL